ncbi:hypothetical protein NA56DRAFT_698907 [Hyaloscypha hepaticicola]|uniref:Uncharacterized protein n=1 Tax=Hyaloscypha hepaticicola TaxID=2082293 RepID=A0A2J6QHW3_9HELO|nr:hypothetical protein NA56DRAFT_698907 [Hyaloscypha hepaticicola]
MDDHLLHVNTPSGPTNEAVVISVLAVLLASVLFATLLSGPAPAWDNEVVQRPETTRLDTNNNSISRILPPQVQDEASDLLPLILVPGYSHYNLASCSISESTSNTIFENGHGRSSNCFPHNVVSSFSSDSLEAASGDEITSFTALR